MLLTISLLCVWIQWLYVKLWYLKKKTKNSQNYKPSPQLFRVKHMVPYTLIPLGLSSSRVLKKPATNAAPHLSLCIPTILPPVFISAPPVSYVRPLPIRNTVESMGASDEQYSSLMIRPRCRSIANIKQINCNLI